MSNSRSCGAVAVAIAALLGCRSSPQPVAAAGTQTIETSSPAVPPNPSPDDADGEGEGEQAPPYDAVPRDQPDEGSKIGIPACDEYVEKFVACIDNLGDGPAKETALRSVDEVVEGWKEVASGPGRETLAQTCESVTHAAARATEGLGCRW